MGVHHPANEIDPTVPSALLLDLNKASLIELIPFNNAIAKP
jgi:hypothetical protein